MLVGYIIITTNLLLMAISYCRVNDNSIRQFFELRHRCEGGLLLAFLGRCSRKARQVHMQNRAVGWDLERNELPLENLADNFNIEKELAFTLMHERKEVVSVTIFSRITLKISSRGKRTT